MKIAPPPGADARTSGRTGIVDIGSNSVRLVVYEGPARAPAVLFNEKVMAGLGAGLARTGALEPEAMDRALAALARFSQLAEGMGVTKLRTVATAAVREASNGPAFLAQLRAGGLDVELLSGEQEAVMAGFGVLAAIPEAEGIVGDLGGGSLELIRVGGGEVHGGASFPLGVLRIAAIREQGAKALDRFVAKALDEAGWLGGGQGLPFYLVGGSWRALARFNMHLEQAALPIVHHHVMSEAAPQQLLRVLAHTDRKRLREVAGLSSSRIATLSDAAALLAVLVRELGSRGLIVSAFGLREGLLHAALAPEVRAQDPLICAAREEGRRQGRFAEHGDLLERWIAPLFAADPPGDARLRHAACLLADVGWRVHPEFRAERGLDIAFQGNWVGIDGRGRAMMARALHASFGGDGQLAIVRRLCTADEEARAERWGLAIRLGQRLSGGVAEPLTGSRLSLDGDALTLHLNGWSALCGESVERRHKLLAASFGRKPVLA